MTPITLDEQNLSAECVRAMRAHLWTSRLALGGDGSGAGQQAEGQVRGSGLVLGVDCDVETRGATKGSSLVVLCARPRASAWTFGSCFPLMPGEGENGGGAGAFYLRGLTLAEPLWVFVYSADGDERKAAARLQEIGLYRDWLQGRAFDDLGFALDRGGAEAGSPTELAAPEEEKQTSEEGAETGNGKARAGLLMWGKLSLGEQAWFTELSRFLAPAAAEQGSEALAWAEKELETLPVKASVLYRDGFPDLVVQLPPNGRSFGHGKLSFQNAAVHLSSPLQFAAEGSSIGVAGDFFLDAEKRIHVELDYPIEGDVIRASGTYLAGGKPLLDTAALGLPGPAPALKAQDEISLELEFSKSEKTLERIRFLAELHEKRWTLAPAPVALELEDVSFRFTVEDPLSSTRSVAAEILAAATLGGDASGAEPVRLLCGGSHPSGRLFLKATNKIPVGRLIEKLTGPSAGLEKLTFDDFEAEYNYRTHQMELGFDVPEMWPIVEGLELGDLKFGLQGAESYTCVVSARLTIALPADLDKPDIDVFLGASYDEGWQFSGSTAPDQDIPVGALMVELGRSFGVDGAAPGSLESLSFTNLEVDFNTATRDFSFAGEAKFEAHGKPVDIKVSIDFSHDSDGSAKRRLSAVLSFESGSRSHEFDVVFADDKEVDLSTLVAAYRSAAGDPPGIRDLVPAEYENSVPDIKTHGAFIAYQTPKKKWLFGLSLEGGLDLSNVKLPDLPLLGSGNPPKSLKLDLQIVLPSQPFEEGEMAAIRRLETSGGIELPSDGLEQVAIATVLHMDGKVVNLKLPVKAVPGHGEEDAPFQHDDTLAPGEQPAAPDGARTVAVAQDDTKWVKVQKNFGPIHVERVGLRYQPKDQRLTVFLDGGLTVSGLTVSLEGLGLETPLTRFDPDFHLSGLGIDFKSGGVELGGAFLKQEIPDPDDAAKTITSYSGQAVLRTETLSLSAIGSYFKYRGEPSLFIYALLEYPLGGPPSLFVIGLAAGFGYNRRAVVPPVEQLHTYPLITKAIAGPAASSPAAAGDGEEGGEKETSLASAKQTLAEELRSLSAYVPPETGQVFLAIGVKFTTYELINSFALVVAQFGEHFQFDLVGVSSLQIPPAEAGGTTGSLLADIHMNWKAVFRPVEGVMGLKAALAPASYLISPDCHVSGGFAYFAWFRGEHAGDFLYTVGGYHPDFEKPDHYPLVPRLGFNWVLKPANLHLKGTLYYAICGHAFMAGGSLDASIHGGFDIGIAGVDFKAHLHIGADFLLSWEPYHYDARVKLELSIAISAHLLFFSKHFDLDIGADLHLWGPEFAGEAHVYLKVWKIKHTLDVTFGHGAPKLRPITWDRFQIAFLPQKKKDGAAPAKKAGPATADTDPTSVCGVSVKRGLIRSAGDRWVVNAKELVLVTDSVIPIKQAMRGDRPLITGEGRFEDAHPAGTGPTVKTDFAVAAMGVEHEDLTTTHTVSITRMGKDRDALFRCEPVLKSVPVALWDKPRFAKDSDKKFLEKPEVNPESLRLPGVLGGLELLPATLTHPSASLPVERGELLYETDLVAPAFQWEPAAAFEAEDERAGWETVNQTLLRAARARSEILGELGFADEDIHLGQPLDDASMIDLPRMGRRA